MDEVCLFVLTETGMISFIHSLVILDGFGSMGKMKSTLKFVSNLRIISGPGFCQGVYLCIALR